MKLEGLVYNFGEDSIGNHVRAIARELSEQAYINGEGDASAGNGQALRDLSLLLDVLASEVDRLAKRLAG